MIFFCVICVLLLLSGCLCVFRALDNAEEPQVVPEATPEPTPPPQPVEVWARYDVPLDDDLQRYIGELCKAYEVPASVVMAVIGVESSYNPDDITDGADYGLMQIRATEHTDRCIRLGAWNLLDPRANVRVGIDYLAELMACGHGIEWALSWYNGHGGEPCEYAYRVVTDAERLLESVQIVTG